jgi:hypothetical protein
MNDRPQYRQYRASSRRRRSAPGHSGGGSGHSRLLAGGTIVLVVALAGAGAALLLRHSRHHASAKATTTATQRTTTTTAPKPLSLVSASPANDATGVSPEPTITLRFSGRIPAGTPMPTISPDVSGSWQRVASDELRFQATSYLMPDTNVTVTLPAELSGSTATQGTSGTGGSSQSSSSSSTTTSTTAAVQSAAATRGILHFSVQQGSTLRLQEILAQLGYLPLSFTQTGTLPSASDAEAYAAFNPPSGTFHWTWANPPSQLVALWNPGVDNIMTKAAVMSFERVNKYPVNNGQPDESLWNTMLSDLANGQKNPRGYSWVLVNKAQPESVTIFHDDKVIFHSLANTGIAATPTPDGSFAIYKRFISTTMQGTNPNGTPYVDHNVPYVNYFHYGDAIHGFVRASYGFPQSLGCVELPIAEAKIAWGLLHYGDVVTIVGGRGAAVDNSVNAGSVTGTPSGSGSVAAGVG